MPTSARPNTSANNSHRRCSCGVLGSLPKPLGPNLGGGQRTAIEFAVKRQRQTVYYHERRRHHLFGQTLTHIITQQIWAESLALAATT
jgi:hypothetical protein